MKEHLYYIFRGLWFLGTVVAIVAACVLPMFIHPLCILIAPTLLIAWVIGQAID